MEDKVTRIRIKIKAGELEIEGTESFVREHLEKYEDLIESFKEAQTETDIPQTETEVQEVSSAMKDRLPETFGEYFHGFRKSISDIDKILIAGYFVQSKSPDSSFTTASANKLLLEQGVKLPNASQSVTRNKSSKKIFTVQGGKFRVSDQGIDYLRGLKES